MVTNLNQTKAGLFEILRRRKRTVASYLEQKGIKTHQHLKKHIKDLERHYVLSEQFRKDAFEYVEKIKAERVFAERNRKETVTDVPEQDSNNNQQEKKPTENKKTSSTKTKSKQKKKTNKKQ